MESGIRIAKKEGRIGKKRPTVPIVVVEHVIAGLVRLIRQMDAGSFGHRLLSLSVRDGYVADCVVDSSCRRNVPVAVGDENVLGAMGSTALLVISWVPS